MRRRGDLDTARVRAASPSGNRVPPAQAPPPRVGRVRSRLPVPHDGREGVLRVTVRAVGAQDLLVVGAWLIGTSVGLAAAGKGWQVAITDQDPRRAEIAAAMGAGTAVTGAPPAAALALVAVPPAEVATVALGLLDR